MPLLSSTLLLRTHALSLVTLSYYLLTSPAQLLSSTPIWLLGESMHVRPAAFALDDPDDAAASPSSGSKGFRAPSLLRTTSARAGGHSESELELFALLALMFVVYAVTQFLFAGDLSLASVGFASASSSSSSSSSKRDNTNTNSSSSSASSSRLAEELSTIYNAQSRWLTLTGLHVLGSAVLAVWIYVFYSTSAAQSQSQLQASVAASFLGLARLANRATFTAAFLDMLFWGYLWTVLKEEGREVAKALARRREVQQQQEGDDE
ncbi:hypothetical protein A1O1_01242 [Capronia coronata CBS 617.96]|uniref:Uncharacterized protein n=1 Tax=Capronia coronata CBS 617.96 TaxID=1182541 RepID=W9Z3F6_9EURO|nr:uncharacterized protein A1O1_01242 [Capronia coronata CBS 617.96]EXJ96116.1 hypothetical protein A1O1_01242 [Capronia coronata CBS 617.96]